MGTNRADRAPVTDWHRSIYYSDLIDAAFAAAKLDVCERVLEAPRSQGVGALVPVMASEAAAAGLSRRLWFHATQR